MTTELIRKEIDINASPEKVWKVLMEDQYNRQWYEVFSKGTHAVTDWQVGSKAIFQDDSNSGIIGIVTENKPNEMLAIKYTGMYINDIEDYDSEKAAEVKGFEEKYVLTGKDGYTHLDVTSDMGAEYFDMMSAAWDKAMQIIKSLAEAL